MRRQWLGVLASLFLGTIFVYAGVEKVFSQSKNLEPFLPQEFLPTFPFLSISAALPYVEIIIGALLIIGITVKLATAFSVVMIAGFMVSNIMLINLGLAAEPCGCFGGGMGGGISVGTSLMLDGIMAAMALTILLFHPDSFKSITPWYLTTEQDTRIKSEGVG